MPHSANMIAAVEALMENNGMVIKDLYDRASKQQDMDIEDLINMAYQRFSDACHNSEDMLEAQEALGDLAENVMKTMLESENVRTIDMDEMKLVVQQAKAMKQMAATGETYHIPMMVGEEAGTMSLRVVRGSAQTGLIKMAIYMQSTGTISTTFKYESNQVEATVECETAQMREMFAEQAPRISGIMQEMTGFGYSFNFVQKVGLSASDIYNLNMGNFAVAEDVTKAREDSIQTEALYKIARGYIDVIAEIF